MKSPHPIPETRSSENEDNDKAILLAFLLNSNCYACGEKMGSVESRPDCQINLVVTVLFGAGCAMLIGWVEKTRHYPRTGTHIIMLIAAQDIAAAILLTARKINTKKRIFGGSEYD